MFNRTQSVTLYRSEYLLRGQQQTEQTGVESLNLFTLCYNQICKKKTDGPILMIYTSYDVFLSKELPFGGRIDCTCVKIFSGVNFFNRD